MMSLMVLDFHIITIFDKAGKLAGSSCLEKRGKNKNLMGKWRKSMVRTDN